VKVEYTRTLDSLVEIQMHCYKNSADYHRRMFILRVVAPCSFVLLALAVMAVTHRVSIVECLPLIAAVLWLVTVPRFFVWRNKSNVRMMLSKGDIEVLLGAQTLTISPEGIHCESEYASSFWKWRAVKSVVEDGDMICIHIAAISALGVPVAAFRDAAEKEEFVKTIQDSIAHRPSQAGAEN